jgi:hypothetical protein
MAKNESGICGRILGMSRTVLFDLALCSLLSNLALRLRSSPEMHGNLRKNM